MAELKKNSNWMAVYVVDRLAQERSDEDIDKILGKVADAIKLAIQSVEKELPKGISVDIDNSWEDDYIEPDDLE